MTTEATSDKGKVWTVAVFFVAVIIVGLFFYFDRNNALTKVFQSWGLVGIVIAIVVMAIVCVTPIPSEGLLILYLKVFGVWWGTFYAWAGAILSSLVVFEAARHVGKPILRSLITPRRFEQVDQWISKRGTVGLLMARLLPIPGFVVSYIVGTMPSVSLWSYVWTAAVSLIPYYVGVALIYLGVSKHLVMGLSIGVIALVLFWAGGYMLRNRLRGKEQL